MILKVVWIAYGIFKVLSGGPEVDPILYLLIEPSCPVRTGTIELTLTGLPLEEEHDADLRQGLAKCVVNEVVRMGP